MVNASVSRLVNQVDKSEFTLYVEWEDACFKIILLRSCAVPLNGEMCTESASYFLDHLDESFETYLEKTKCAFSGATDDVQFFLQDDTFTWKQQNILTRGEIAVYPLSNILILSDTLKQLSELYQKCQERMLVLEKENEQLNRTNTKLIADMEEMIKIKTTMEKDLYTRFLLLLNTKKKRIRELQEALDSKDSKERERTVYDETTDEESDESDVESRKVGGTKSANTKKRDTSESDQKTKSSKRDFKRCANPFVESRDSSASPEPSTSKGKLASRDTVRRATKCKRVFSDESEEDLFSE